MQAKAKYAVSGALAGAVNGLFGGGGGMVLVPLLSGWCGRRDIIGGWRFGVLVYIAGAWDCICSLKHHTPASIP